MLFDQNYNLTFCRISYLNSLERCIIHSSAIYINAFNFHVESASNAPYAKLHLNPIETHTVFNRQFMFFKNFISSFFYKTSNISIYNEIYMARFNMKNMIYRISYAIFYHLFTLINYKGAHRVIRAVRRSEFKFDQKIDNFIRSPSLEREVATYREVYLAMNLPFERIE